MRAIFPEHEFTRLAASDPLLSEDFGGADLRSVLVRDPSGSSRGEKLQVRQRKVEPNLEALRLGERYAVIFSPLDISCALEKHESLQCRGYAPKDAAKIALNAILYALHQ